MSEDRIVPPATVAVLAREFFSALDERDLFVDIIRPDGNVMAGDDAEPRRGAVGTDAGALVAGVDPVLGEDGNAARHAGTRVSRTFTRPRSVSGARRGRKPARLRAHRALELTAGRKSAKVEIDTLR